MTKSQPPGVESKTVTLSGDVLVTVLKSLGRTRDQIGHLVRAKSREPKSREERSE